MPDSLTNQLRSRADAYREEAGLLMTRGDLDGAAVPREKAERLDAAADRIDALEAALGRLAKGADMTWRTVKLKVRSDDLAMVLDMAKDWSDSLADAATPYYGEGKPDESTMRLVRRQRIAIKRIKDAKPDA